MSDIVKIYAIINPMADEVIYVGASKNPVQRYNCHVSLSTWQPTTYRYKQMKKMIINKIIPELLILDSVSISDAKFYEDFYIQLLKTWGYKLNGQMPKSSYSLRRQKPPRGEIISVSISKEKYLPLRNSVNSAMFFNKWVEQAIDEKLYRDTWPGVKWPIKKETK